MFGPLSVSLAPYVNSSKTLSRWVKPIANWYADAMRYRQYGFKYDDLSTSLQQFGIFEECGILIDVVLCSHGGE